jgi:hypothetical protein
VILARRGTIHKIGTWYKNDDVYQGDSTIQLWVAREHQPSKLVVNLSTEPGTLFGMKIPGSGTVMTLSKATPTPSREATDTAPR